MTEAKHNKAQSTMRKQWLHPAATFVLCALCFVLFPGCRAEPRNFAAVDAYYAYDLPAAREALRREAETQSNEQTILNNVRLGLAALADGDLLEAERTLNRSFDLLSTAGLNRDKTVASVLDHEGVRIWKGEPFEQALTYHYVSLLYALQGDWDNVRAAAANSLFRLTDFGASELRGRGDEDSYTAVDTNFALGFLMEAIGSDLSGAGGAAGQFNAALEINPDLKPVVDRLRERDYDTILLVDYGRGPLKQAYGPDLSLARFVPVEHARPRLIVSAGEQPLGRLNPVCDVNAMAQDLRWNNLEGVRQAKSFLGNALLLGGAGATAYGAHRNDGATALAGVGVMALGLLSKSGARADTRQCEFMPALIYLVPLRLEHAADLTIAVDGRPHARIVLNDLRPGSTDRPRACYVRLFEDAPPDAAWLTRRRESYSNDATGVASGPQGYPWILGGRDLSTPSAETLAAYQANGFLREFTLTDLENLYRAEGMLIGAGSENRRDMPKNPSFRHVLEGGTGLFTPYHPSIGYKRVMCSPAPPYQPQSELVRNAARSLRVQQSDDRHARDGRSGPSNRSRPLISEGNTPNLP